MKIVYFIQVYPAGQIKIGHTSRVVSARINLLQHLTSEKLVWIGFVFGARKEELALHRAFAKDRLRGEWFNPSKELLRFIRLSSPNFDPEKAEANLVLARERKIVSNFIRPRGYHKKSDYERIGALESVCKFSCGELHRWLADGSFPDREKVALAVDYIVASTKRKAVPIEGFVRL